jgi:hypothetical protein
MSATLPLSCSQSAAWRDERCSIFTDADAMTLPCEGGLAPQRTAAGRCVTGCRDTGERSGGVLRSIAD